LPCEHWENAFAQAIAKKPEEAGPLESRARFRIATYDFSGAISYLSAAIDIKASADLFRQRAEMNIRLRDWTAAKADLKSAYALDPSHLTAIRLADTMSTLGEIDEARDLLVLQNGDTEAQRMITFALAELDALYQRALIMTHGPTGACRST